MFIVGFLGLVVLGVIIIWMFLVFKALVAVIVAGIKNLAQDCRDEWAAHKARHNA